MGEEISLKSLKIDHNFTFQERFTIVSFSKINFKKVTGVFPSVNLIFRKLPAWKFQYFGILKINSSINHRLLSFRLESCLFYK
jgi:hypothetical protein